MATELAASKDEPPNSLEGDASEQTARGKRLAEVEGAAAAASAPSADFSSACLMVDMQASAGEPNKADNISIVAFNWFNKRFQPRQRCYGCDAPGRFRELGIPCCPSNHATTAAANRRRKPRHKGLDFKI